MLGAAVLDLVHVPFLVVAVIVRHLDLLVQLVEGAVQVGTAAAVLPAGLVAAETTGKVVVLEPPAKATQADPPQVIGQVPAEVELVHQDRRLMPAQEETEQLAQLLEQVLPVQEVVAVDIMAAMARATVVEEVALEEEVMVDKLQQPGDQAQPIPEVVEVVVVTMAEIITAATEDQD
jgi:hypothetical protein